MTEQQEAIRRLLQANGQQVKQSVRRRRLYENAALGLAIVLLALDVFWDLKINGSITLLFVNHQWPEIVLLLLIVWLFRIPHSQGQIFLNAHTEGKHLAD